MMDSIKRITTELNTQLQESLEDAKEQLSELKATAGQLEHYAHLLDKDTDVDVVLALADLNVKATMLETTIANVIKVLTDG